MTSKNNVKHIFITGGVISSLGKGVTASAIALLLIRRGYKVAIQKLDPYLNIDPGTMSPYQHGEVYVTEDGTETDLDLGHYERFANIKCNINSNYTAGQIYKKVLDRERSGGYLGQTVQVIPHITNEIKSAIDSLKEDVDILITEIGGTVGDIESLPFMEVIRQYRHEQGVDNSIFIHLTFIPFINATKELKTKPSQQSVGILREIGIIADFLICRSEKSLNKEIKEKISLFCNVSYENVIEEVDVKYSIYEIPLILKEQNLDIGILNRFKLPVNKLDLSDWQELLNKIKYCLQLTKSINVCIMGKYTSLEDAYKSITEALNHASIKNMVKLNIEYIDSSSITKNNVKDKLEKFDVIIIPGGFGNRGIDGKITTIKYARENKICFLGICLGLQCTVIEYARNVANIPSANSAEFNNEGDFVIDIMENQKSKQNTGGTMRLGNYKCEITKDTQAFNIYKNNNIVERHRHRYEFNNQFKSKLEEKGLVFSGINLENNLVEIVELPNNKHPFFIACQFHPEFNSSPINPHPLFVNLIEKSISLNH